LLGMAGKVERPLEGVTGRAPKGDRREIQD
jgi:hypothetical protein